MISDSCDTPPLLHFLFTTSCLLVGSSCSFSPAFRSHDIKQWRQRLKRHPALWQSGAVSDLPPPGSSLPVLLLTFISSGTHVFVGLLINVHKMNVVINQRAIQKLPDWRVPRQQKHDVCFLSFTPNFLPLPHFSKLLPPSLCLLLQAASWYYHKKRYPASHGSNGRPRSRVHHVQLIGSFQDGRGGDDSEEEVHLLDGSNLWHSDPVLFPFLVSSFVEPGGRSVPSTETCRPWEGEETW